MDSFTANHKTYTPDVSKNIDVKLVQNLYNDARISIIASIFCATILFIGIYNHNEILFANWYIFSISINLLRLSLLGLYYSGKFNVDKNNVLWRNIFLIGSIASSVSWAIVSYWIFPIINDPLKILTILILAGVTAGGTPALSPSKTASLSFLWIILVPLIMQIEFTHSKTLSLFGISAIVYLLYLTLLALRMNKSVISILELQYENISLLKKLKHLATHDPLTNLDNVRYFYENLSHAIERAKTKDTLLSLLYIDLDKFKDVNDHYGHSVGDKVLKYATEIIRQQLNANDMLARLGGDEFAVILEYENKHDIIELAKRICEKLSQPIKIDNILINVSASIGISFYPVHGKNIDDLIKAADQAMYYVKRHGSNNYYISKEDKVDQSV